MMFRLYMQNQIVLNTALFVSKENDVSAEVPNHRNRVSDINKLFNFDSKKTFKYTTIKYSYSLCFLQTISMSIVTSAICHITYSN